MEKLNILILSTSPKSSATQLFVNSAKKRGHNPIVKNPSELYLFISESENGYDRIYDGSENEVQRIHAKSIDAIIPRIHSGVNYGIKLIRHFNQNLGIYSIQSASGIRSASDKMETSQKLSFAGVKTPKTIIASEPKHIKFLIEKIDNLPAIAKTVKGSLGVGVMILESPLQTNTTLEMIYKNNIDVLLQRFVDGNSQDIRAIVCGNEVIAAMKRTGKKGDIRANVSQGGTGEAITLSKEDQQLCIEAAKSIKLEICGVDLIKDKEGNSYIIEINSAFGMKIQEITGIDISGKIIEHIEKNYKTGNTATSSNLTNQVKTEVKELSVWDEVNEYCKTHTTAENVAFMRSKNLHTF